MDDVFNSISEVFKKRPEVLFGISKIEFSELKTDYKCALVFAMPHKELLSLNSYEEEKFKALISEARTGIAALSEEIGIVLKNHGIRYSMAPPQYDEETFVSKFSLKFAAVNAGLGWIGKNGLFVTEKYGPRVRLAAVLIDYDLKEGIPVKESKCPVECKICVEACPNSILFGRQWDIETKREELIEYKSCENNGKVKSGCGLCMVSCPLGI